MSTSEGKCVLVEVGALISWCIYSYRIVMLLVPYMWASMTFLPIFSSVNSLYISYGTSWETLITYQDILSLVVISFILMACMFDQEVKRGTSKQFACV